MKKLILSSIISSSLMFSAANAHVSAMNVHASSLIAFASGTTANVSADLAEKAYKDLVEATNKSYQRTLSSSGLGAFKYTVSSYEKGKDSSTAVTDFSMKSEDLDLDFEFSLKSTIQHDESVTSAGLVAKVSSEVVPPKDLDDKVKNIIKKVEMTTEIKKDLSYTQMTHVGDFDVEDDSDKLSFKGFEMKTESTIAHTANGFGKNDFDFKGLTVGGDEVKVEQFKMGGEFKPNGDLKYSNSTPLVVNFKKDDTKMSMDSLVVDGKLTFNEKYSIYIGKINYAVKDINFTSKDPQADGIAIDTITIKTDTSIKGDALSQDNNVTVKFGKGVVQKMSSGMADISDANIAMNFKNAPASLLKLANRMDKLSEDSPEVTEAFNQMKKLGSELEFDISLTTPEGKATLDSDFKVKTGSPVTIKDISSDPKKMLELFDINATVTLPAALVEKFGLQAQAGPFLAKEGDVYKAVLETKDAKITVNGNPIPM